jgi:hypothetical protein
LLAYTRSYRVEQTLVESQLSSIAAPDKGNAISHVRTYKRTKWEGVDAYFTVEFTVWVGFNYDVSHIKLLKEIS